MLQVANMNVKPAVGNTKPSISIPLVTVALILSTLFLFHLRFPMYQWTIHAGPRGERFFEELRQAFLYLAIYKVTMIGICSTLVFLNWRNRLWHPWLAIGIFLLWLIMVATMLGPPAELR